VNVRIVQEPRSDVFCSITYCIVTEPHQEKK